VARFDARKIRSLLADPASSATAEVESAITNARAFLRVQEEFAASIATSGASSKARRARISAGHQRIPARTAESDAMSKLSKERGFNSWLDICYAYMQRRMINTTVAASAHELAVREPFARPRLPRPR